MSKRNLLNGKARREQRRVLKFNPIAKDLHTPKYRQRVIERKRIDNDDQTYFFADRYYEDEIDW